MEYSLRSEMLVVALLSDYGALFSLMAGRWGLIVYLPDWLVLSISLGKKAESVDI